MKKPSQADRLLQLLSDGQPHSTPEIQLVVYGGSHLGTARIASRVTDLRERGRTIDSWPDPENKTVWHYQLKDAPSPKPVLKWESVTLPDGTRAMRQVAA